MGEVRAGKRVSIGPAFTTQTYTGQWTWNSQSLDPNPTSLSDPSPESQAINNGEFRTDSRNWSGASILELASADLQGQPASKLFAVMATGDTIHVVQANNNSNWSDYTLTATPTQDASGISWSLPVNRDSGTGQASNGQTTTITFTVAVDPGEQTPARSCTDYDLDGYKLHSMPIQIFLSSSTVGPEVAWCQYCHEIFVTNEPTPPSG